MKSLSKNLMIIILIFSFTFCSLSGCLFPAVDAIKNMDTPVANLSKDVYSTYKNGNNGLNDFAKNIEAMGGCVYTKEEYENLYNNKGITADFSSAADVEPQRQVITVMSTATGSTDHDNFVKSEPIANAIVRINGVPRYTDRNGQVKVTLDKEYVELIVEKNDYNPYIEIMEVSNTEKVVHLKKESDDIEIFGVMLTEIETLPVNLINSKYTILLEDLPVYVANMQFLTNVKADTYNLLLENEVIYSSDENIIYDIDFNEDMENKKFYAQVEYQGIVSKLIKLNLTIKNELKLNDTPSEPDIEPNEHDIFESVETNGMFESINFDILKYLSYLNKKLPVDKLNLSIDRRKGTVTLSVGFAFSHTKTKKKEEKTKEVEEYKKIRENLAKERTGYQNMINDCQKKIDAIKASDKANNKETLERLEKEKAIFKSDLNDVSSKISNLFKGMAPNIKELNQINDEIQNDCNKNNKQAADIINQKNNGVINKDALNKMLFSMKNFVNMLEDQVRLVQNNKGISVGGELLGVIKISYVTMEIVSFSLTLDGSISFNWNGIIVIASFPIYYTVTLSAGIGLAITVYNEQDGWIKFDDITKDMLFKARLGLNGEVGVGLSGVLSVGLYAGANAELSAYIFSKEFYTKNFYNFLGYNVNLQIGIHFKVFFFDYKWGTRYDKNKNPLTHQEMANVNQETLKKSVSYSSLNETNTLLLSNSLQSDSKTKIEKVGDNYVATWVDMIFEGDVPRTILKYSVLKNNAWSTPKSIDVKGNAFYHDMYFDGEDLHLTWQNVKEGVDVSSLEQMSANSEIYYAKFNQINNEFANVKQITNDSTLDAAPHFVLQENDSQNLAIAWQKNSLNDIMSLTGKNSIVYSECVGGSWSACQTLYESDNYFSFVDTAYVDGKLTTTCIEDLDNDLFTNDRKIKVIQKSETEKIVGDKFTEVNNPQFNKIDGKVCLSFYGDGNVHYSENFEQVKTFDIEQGKVNDTYKILENDNKLYIYYYKLSAEGSQQAFATIYDKVSDSWQYDVCLTSSENQVLYPAICVLENGDILTIYNANNEAEEIVSLEYNVKQMRKDFEITYAFYDMNSQVGDTIKLNIGLKNTGDYPIKNIKVSVFGQTEDIVLEKALQIDETIFVEVERVFAINAQGTETIVCQYEDVQKEYLLATRLTDIAIEGNVTFDTFKEYYNLKLTNSSDYSSKVYMDVYYKGKIVETIELFLDGNSSLDYTYFNDNFENENFVCFVIRTDVADKYESDNKISFRISNMAEKKNELQNKYYDILQMVKAF